MTTDNPVNEPVEAEPAPTAPRPADSPPRQWNTIETNEIPQPTLRNMREIARNYGIEVDTPVLVNRNIAMNSVSSSPAQLPPKRLKSIRPRRPKITLNGDTEKMLGTKRGREAFDEVFGKNSWKNRYRPTKEERALINGTREGTTYMRYWAGRGANPRKMLADLVGMENSNTDAFRERLNQVFYNCFWGRSEREGWIWKRGAKTLEDFQNRPQTWLRRIRGYELTHGRVPPAELRWVLALYWSVAPKYKSIVSDVLLNMGKDGSLSRDVWGMLPKDEVIRLVRIWLQGDMYVDNFSGRNELGTRILLWAYLRVRFLPEIPAATIVGLIDIQDFPNYVTEDSHQYHCLMGHATSATGIHTLKRRWDFGKPIGPLATLIDKDYKELITDRIAAGEFKDRKPTISSQHCRQVMLFRIARGMIDSADWDKRTIQFGPTMDMFSWRHRGARSCRLTVVAASTLGYEAVWGWTVLMEGEGRGTVLVVPDKVWDSMIPFWEKGYIVWPQFIEAGGLGDGVTRVPMWNDRIGGHCFGSASLRGYAQGGKPSGGNPIARNSHDPHQRQLSFWEQPRIACIMMEGSFSMEAVMSGNVRSYIPTEEFVLRMGLVIKRCEERAWGLKEKLPIDMEFAIVSQSMRLVMQTICQIGEGHWWRWQYPVCGDNSHQWFWAVDDNVFFGVKEPWLYPGLIEVMNRVCSRNFATSCGWLPGGVIPVKEPGKGFTVQATSVIDSVSTQFSMGFRKGEIAIDTDSQLIPWDMANDMEKKPWWSGEISQVTIKKRIRGKKRIATVNPAGLDSPKELYPPACGEITCMDPACNGDIQVLNHIENEKPKVQWHLIPSNYRRD